VAPGVNRTAQVAGGTHAHGIVAPMLQFQGAWHLDYNDYWLSDDSTRTAFNTSLVRSQRLKPCRP